MDVPEHGRSYAKRGLEEHSDTKSDKFDEEEDWDGTDKRKNRPSKSRKHGSIDENEEWDNSGKRKSSGDRDGKKKSINLSRAGSGEEDDYDTRRGTRSKTVKKTQEDRSQKKSTSGDLERESENSRKSREEGDRSLLKKASAKPSSHEGFQAKFRTKADVLVDGEIDKIQDRDAKSSERKDSRRDTDHGTREPERIPRRRWDELDGAKKGEDRGYIDKSDSQNGGNDADLKGGTSRERNVDSRIESGESKSRGTDSNSERGVRSSNREDRREDRRLDSDRSRSRAKLDVREDDSRTSVREGRSEAVKDDKQKKVTEESESGGIRPSSRTHSEKIDKQIPQRGSAHRTRDERESRERSVLADDDERGRLRDRSGRDVRKTSKRSRTPERSDRRRPEVDEIDRGFSDSDNERSGSHRDKEYDKDGHREDRRKGRDASGWTDRVRGWESSKDGWKKRNPNRHDRDLKDTNVDFEYEKEWDVRQRERERIDYDKVHGRPNYRRDRGRIEGGHESSDTIEIKPNTFDYGREDAGPGFGTKRAESSQHAEFTSINDEEWGYMHEDRSRMVDSYGPSDDTQDRYPDDGSLLDQSGLSSGRTNFDMQGEKVRMQKASMNLYRASGGQMANNGLQPPLGNSQGSAGSFNRSGPQGTKSGGGRPIRGRGRIAGRDARVGLPLPMMGPPFGPMGLPPGPMQPIGPSMSLAPGPPMGPGVFVPSFPAAPLVWPGARGVDMNLLGVPPGLSPLPSPGHSGPRFPPNMGTGPNPAVFFNPPGPGRGTSPGFAASGFNATGSTGRGMPHDKAQGGWLPPRISGPPGKAPSRGEQNDYSQNFVDTGMRPQNFIRELELTSTVEDYPKLRELIQKKDEIVANAATPPMYFKCDLREFVLSPEFFGTKFDVILVDPPWEEYVHRAPGVADHMEYWTFEEILSLKIEAIADTPSFIFLWVGDGVGLEQGRACLKKWGFRRCEDICWVKTNKSNATPGLRHDSHTLFQHSKEHCLMGIKGTVRRSTDGHIIHANIDTDIVIAEEPPYGSTTKPEDLYRIIEHFSLGRRRLELFGEDHNIRAGWLTVGKGLSSSNFNAEAYVKNFADKDGKVWLGGGGRNPPPDAPHLVLTTPDIESLRPKSPPAKNQQQQQQSTSIQTTANSGNKRPAVNSPQNMTPSGPHGLNQEASGSNPATPMPWASPMCGLKIGLAEGSNMGPDDKFLDGFGYNSSFGQPNIDHQNIEPHITVNML